MKFFKLSTFTLAITLLLSLFINNETTFARTIMWGKTELKVGQIGKVTILSEVPLMKIDSSGQLQEVRQLKKGDEFRVYSYKGQLGGLYGVGGSSFIRKNPSKVKYETPSKTKLHLLKSEELKNQGGKTFADGWTSPVITSKWTNDPDKNLKVITKELNLYEQCLNINQQSCALMVGYDGNSFDGIIRLRTWYVDYLKESYRVPIITEQVLRFYFEEDWEKVYDAIVYDQFPYTLEANDRLVKVQYVERNGVLLIYIGHPNKSF